MTTFKVRGEWLVDEHNKIVKRPLSFWLDYFGVVPVPDRPYFFRTKDGKPITIELRGGYGMTWKDREKYLNELFCVGNADLYTNKIKQYRC